MPIKTYSTETFKIPYNIHQMGDYVLLRKFFFLENFFSLLKSKQHCRFEFLSFIQPAYGAILLCEIFYGDHKSSIFMNC